VTSDSNDGCIMLVLLALAIVVLLGIGIAVDWYHAGVQQQVWERQGVHMSRWEVFMGAKPIVRQIVPGEAP
jgi:hypothetical protein